MRCGPFAPFANYCASYRPSSDPCYSASVPHSSAGLAAGSPACYWAVRLSDSVPAEALDALAPAEAQACSAEHCSAEVSALRSAAAADNSAGSAAAPADTAAAEDSQAGSAAVAVAAAPADTAAVADSPVGLAAAAADNSAGSAAAPADTAAVEDSAADSAAAVAGNLAAPAAAHFAVEASAVQLPLVADLAADWTECRADSGCSAGCPVPDSADAEFPAPGPPDWLSELHDLGTTDSDSDCWVAVAGCPVPSGTDRDGPEP